MIVGDCCSTCGSSTRMVKAFPKSKFVKEREAFVKFSFKFFLWIEKSNFNENSYYRLSKTFLLRCHSLQNVVLLFLLLLSKPHIVYSVDKRVVT